MLATGDLKAEEGAKFTAGRMGEYTIQKDATRGKGLRILMGGSHLRQEQRRSRGEVV